MLCSGVGSLLVLSTAGAEEKLWCLLAGTRRALRGMKLCVLGVDAQRESGRAGVAAELHSSSLGTTGPHLVLLAS